MAEALKKQHFREHPDYQYQPRKAVDKKRRMTRRKIQALTTVSASSSVVPSSTASALVEPEAEKKISPTLPEFPKTENGNVVLNIGDEDLEDETFAQMLQNYNATVLPMAHQIGQFEGNDFSAVLSSGVSQEALYDSNYYLSMVDFNKDCKSTDELAAEMDEILKGATTTEEMLTATGQDQNLGTTFVEPVDEPLDFSFDTYEAEVEAEHHTNFDAELARMCTFFDH